MQNLSMNGLQLHKELTVNTQRILHQGCSRTRIGQNLQEQLFAMASTALPAAILVSQFLLLIKFKIYRNIFNMLYKHVISLKIYIYCILLFIHTQIIHHKYNCNMKIFTPQWHTNILRCPFKHHSYPVSVQTS